MRIKEWSIKAGQMVAAGERVAVIASKKDTIIGHVRAPKAGMIEAVLDSGSPIPDGPLFSTRYFDDGSLIIVDPFSDLARYEESFRGVLKNERDELIKSLKKIIVVPGVAVLLGIIFGAAIWGGWAAFLIMLLGFGVIFALARPKMMEMAGYQAALKKYFP